MITDDVIQSMLTIITIFLHRLRHHRLKQQWLDANEQNTACIALQMQPTDISVNGPRREHDKSPVASSFFYDAAMEHLLAGAAAAGLVGALRWRKAVSNPRRDSRRWRAASCSLRATSCTVAVQAVASLHSRSPPVAEEEAEAGMRLSAVTLASTIRMAADRGKR